MLASASPEALIGPIAAATERIRVGSGGVMLPHYSPLKVAETFTILAGLYPGRIDLGLGRAAGTDPMTTFALQRDRRQAAPDDFPQQLAELLAYFDDSLPADHPFARLAGVLPGRPELPVAVAARLLAAERDLGRRARRCRTRSPTSSTPRGPRSPSSTASGSSPPSDSPAPRTAVAVWVLCAPTDEEAEFLATSSRMSFTLLRRNELIPVPPPEKAVEFLEREGKQPVGRPARPPRASSARPRRSAPGIEEAGGRVRRRGGDRGHDHLRPPGAPALLRAAGRGLRPRAAARLRAQLSRRRADEARRRSSRRRRRAGEIGARRGWPRGRAGSESDPTRCSRHVTSNFSPSDPWCGIRLSFTVPAGSTSTAIMQIEVAGDRPVLDVQLGARLGRLALIVAFEHLDLLDYGRVPARVPIDGREQRDARFG